MDVDKLSKDIVEMLSGNFDTKSYEKDTSAIIWAGFRTFLNAAYKMRKYQKQYFEHKDTMSLKEAKEAEKDFDKFLVDLINQKQQPKLRF